MERSAGTEKSSIEDQDCEFREDGREVVDESN